MSAGSIVGDCRAAADALSGVGEFETGQAIYREAAEEIERLRTALYLYGDRHAMSRARLELQYSIDVAMEMSRLHTAEKS